MENINSNEFKNKLNAIISVKLSDKVIQKFPIEIKILISNFLNVTLKKLMTEIDSKNITNYRNILSQENKAFIKKYDELYKIYNNLKQSGASNKEINDVARLMNSISYVCNVFNEMVSLTKNIQKESPNKVKKNEENKILIKKEHLELKETHEYLLLTRTIRQILLNMSSLDEKSKEREEWSQKYFKFASERRKLISDLYSSNIEKYREIYQKLLYVEAQERIIYIDKSVDNNKHYSKDEYLKEIQSLLNNINELSFDDSLSEDVDLKVKKLTDVFLSLFGNFNDEKDISNDKKEEYISLKDKFDTLLNLITKFNLKGGYDSFKKYYSNGKIGNEAISREMYNSAINEIKSLFGQIIRYANSNIDEKGIDVTNHSKSKNEKELELYSIYHNDICSNIYSVVMNKGFIK